MPSCQLYPVSHLAPLRLVSVPKNFRKKSRARTINFTEKLMLLQQHDNNFWLHYRVALYITKYIHVMFPQRYVIWVEFLGEILMRKTYGYSTWVSVGLSCNGPSYLYEVHGLPWLFLMKINVNVDIYGSTDAGVLVNWMVRVSLILNCLRACFVLGF